MIGVRVGELGESETDALVRPVAAEFSAVTAAMRRFEEAAGPTVREQCERLGELPLGSAAITAAGDLTADYIVHVAVRSATENASPSIVRQGLENALRRLDDWGLRTVALAPLGTGAGNLDAEESAECMIPELAAWLGGGPDRSAVIVVDDGYQESAFRTALARHGVGRPAEPEP